MDLNTFLFYIAHFAIQLYVLKICNKICKSEKIVLTVIGKLCYRIKSIFMSFTFLKQFMNLRIKIQLYISQRDGAIK